MKLITSMLFSFLVLFVFAFQGPGGILKQSDSQQTINVAAVNNNAAVIQFENLQLIKPNYLYNKQALINYEQAYVISNFHGLKFINNTDEQYYKKNQFTRTFYKNFYIRGYSKSRTC